MTTATVSEIAMYGVMNMETKPPLKPALVDVVKKVRALRALTKDTGFVTGRTVGALLSQLSQEDLIRVAEALEESKQ